MEKPPPCSHTITGRLPWSLMSGVQMFRFWQLLSVPVSSDGAEPPNMAPCGDVGPYAFASKTPSHGSTSCAGLNRSSAVAYGMPRYRKTLSCRAPRTSPYVVRTSESPDTGRFLNAGPEGNVHRKISTTAMAMMTRATRIAPMIIGSLRRRSRVVLVGVVSVISIPFAFETKDVQNAAMVHRLNSHPMMSGSWLNSVPPPPCWLVIPWFAKYAASLTSNVTSSLMRRSERPRSLYWSRIRS